MITLTTPAHINSILGADSPASYDRLVLSPININPVEQSINANIRLSSSAGAESPVIGSLTIMVPQSKLFIEVGNLVRKSMSLTAGQNAAALKVINDTQNALESGLISLTAVQGTQSAGV